MYATELGTWQPRVWRFGSHVTATICIQLELCIVVAGVQCMQDGN